MIALDNLKRLAEKVINFDRAQYANNPDPHRLEHDFGMTWQDFHDAANPEAILALIAELEQRDEKVERLITAGERIRYWSTAHRTVDGRDCIHEWDEAVADLGNTVDWVKRIVERVVDIFYERSRGADKPLSRSVLKKKFERKDWWVSSEESLKYGLCDVIE